MAVVAVIVVLCEVDGFKVKLVVIVAPLATDVPVVVAVLVAVVVAVVAVAVVSVVAVKGGLSSKGSMSVALLRYETLLWPLRTPRDDFSTWCLRVAALRVVAGVDLAVDGVLTDLLVALA